MGKKQDVFDPKPPFMKCDVQIKDEEKRDLRTVLKTYEDGEWAAEEKLDGIWGDVRIEKGIVKYCVSAGGTLKNFEPMLNYRFPDWLSGSLMGELAYGSSCPKMKSKTAVFYDHLNLKINKSGSYRSIDSTLMSNAERWEVLKDLNCWDQKVHPVERQYDRFYEMYRRISIRQIL